MKLSVIIPVYNVESFLPACLDSLCFQIKDDVEVILVDDGSTDSSGRICDEYATCYPFISVIHQQNQGLGAARNAGMTIAKGDYIAWIDSDDYVAATWVSKILAAIETTHADVIFFDLIKFDRNWSKTFCYGKTTGFIPQEQFLENLLSDVRMKSYTWQKVVQRDFVIPAPFLEEKKPLEDFEVAYRLFKNINTVYYIAEPLYYYRVRANSLSRGNNFELVWYCYELAIKREKEVDVRYKKAAGIARTIQAFGVCRAFVKNGKILQHQARYQEARKYIRKNLLTILCDMDISVSYKIKFLLISLNINPNIALKHH